MNKHGWTYKKLGDICETSSGGTPSKNHREYYENGSIPWLRSGEVSQTHISETELFITQLGLDNSSAKIFPVDTVVIAMYGATVGQVGILKKAMCTNQAVCGVFPNSFFKPDFLMHFLKSKKSFFLKQAVGGAQSNISQAIIKNLKLPVPSMEEQEAIVDELDEINETIELLKQQVSDLDKLEQSTFYTMFGDPVSNPKGWVVKKLGDVGEIITGSTPSTSDETNWDGDVNWVTPAELGDQLFYGETARKITAKAASRLTLMPIGTVLLSSRAPIGKIAIASVPMCCNQGFKNIVCDDTLNNIYLFFFLKATMDRIIALGRGATFKEVSKKDISKFGVALPPLALQQEFAAEVEAIESAKAELNAQIAEMQTLLASRMDYYFD